jgi:hypothetical protein
MPMGFHSFILSFPFLSFSLSLFFLEFIWVNFNYFLKMLLFLCEFYQIVLFIIFFTSDDLLFFLGIITKKKISIVWLLFNFLVISWEIILYILGQTWISKRIKRWNFSHIYNIYEKGMEMIYDTLILFLVPFFSLQKNHSLSFPFVSAICSL